MGPTQNVTFLLTRMRADGHLLGLSRLCQIDFNNNFYMPYMNLGGSSNDTVFDSFAKLFPELKDTVDPSRLVFIGTVFYLIRLFLSTMLSRLLVEVNYVIFSFYFKMTRLARRFA